jgi:hypothetical protein
VTRTTTITQSTSPLAWSSSGLPAGLLDRSQIGAAGGIAGLDGTGKVPTGQVPDLSGEYVAGGPTLPASTALMKFVMGPRSSVTSLAVPTVQPQSANQPGVMDISSTGSGYLSGNGTSWLDIGGPDLLTTNNPGQVARLAWDATNNNAYAGLVAYNGYAGTIASFYLTVPTNGNSGMTPAVKMAPATGGTAGGDDYTLSADPAVILAAHGGSVVAASGYRLKTAATMGFLNIPRINGTPTGTPIGYGQTTPLAFDDATHKLWAYTGGAWKSVTLA